METRRDETTREVGCRREAKQWGEEEEGRTDTEKNIIIGEAAARRGEYDEVLRREEEKKGTREEDNM